MKYREISLSIHQIYHELDFYQKIYHELELYQVMHSYMRLHNSGNIERLGRPKIAVS